MPSLGHSSSSGNTNKVLLHGACVPGKKSINKGAGQGVTEGRESCSYVGRDQPSLEASTTEVITEKVLRKVGVCPDSVLLGVLVGSGCYDKALQTRGASIQTFIPHASGGWKSKTNMLAGKGPSEPSPWHVDRHLLPVSSRCFHLCVSVSSSLLIKAPARLDQGLL